MEYYQFNKKSWDSLGVDPNSVLDDETYASLRLSKMLNKQVEIVASDLDKSDQNGAPVNLYELIDNSKLPANYTKQSLARTLSTRLKKAITSDQKRAVYFGADMAEWNAISKEEDAYQESLYPRIWRDEKNEQNAGKNERRARTQSGSFRDYTADQSYMDFLNPTDAKKRGELEKEPEKPISPEELWLTDTIARKEKYKEIVWQKKVNSIVNALDSYWPTDFRKESDRVLEARLKLLNEYGIDTAGVSMEELRRTRGFQWQEMFNPFGVLDAKQLGRDIGWLIGDLETGGGATRALMDVDENSPIELQERLLEMLKKERESQLPETTFEKIANSFFESVAFFEEMAITSGLGAEYRAAKTFGKPMLSKLVSDGYRALWKEYGWKGVKQALKEGAADAGASMLKRLPWYIPTKTAETLSEMLPQSVTVTDDFGNPSITIQDHDVTDFFQRFVTKMVSQGVELFTEELGGLIPFGDLDARVITAFTPKVVRNFVAQNLIRNPMTRRIAERALLDAIPFDGLIGEFGEEAIGNFIMYGATLLGRAMNFREENTAMVNSPWMSGEEAGVTLGSIALQNVIFRGLQLTSAELSGRGYRAAILNAERARREMGHLDVIETLLSETRVSNINLNEATRALDLARGGDSTVVVSTNVASDILMQAVKDKTDKEQEEIEKTFAAVGLTDAVIKDRKNLGLDVFLSQNRLLALYANKNYKNGKDVARTLLENAASVVFGKTTKEITADSFTKEQIDAMVDKSKRQQEFLRDAKKTMAAAVRTAQQNAIAAGNKLGISQQTVQDFVNIYSWMANYLAENVETEEGLAKLKEMVQKLSVQFAEAPEKFDTTAARDALGQVSPVWTGSAASYDQPSVVYIGTGEGNAAFGWGLYGSSDKGVGQWYAKQDVRRKGKYLPPYRYAYQAARTAVTLKGGRVLAEEDAFRNPDSKTDAENAWEEIIYELSDYLQRRYEGGFEGTITADELRDAAIKQITWRIERWSEDPTPNSNVLANYKAVLNFLQDSGKGDEIEFNDFEMKQLKGRNLYKQTFWPDKEENLLDWDEYIEAEQAKQILRQAEEEHLFDIIPKEEKFSYGDSVIDSTVYLRTYLTGAADGETILQGRGLYYTLEKIFGSKQKASEFLHRAGIDGITYIGPESGARNYVAFSDKDIRVDEHILFQDGVSNALKNAFLSEKDVNIRQAYPVNSGEDVGTVLIDLAGKDIVNRDQDIPAQVNRRQREKLVSSTAVEKSIANGFTERDHMEAVANIEALYENAILLQERGDLKNGEPEVIIRRFVAPIVIRGEVVDAILTQKESIDKKSSARVYTLELDELVREENVNGAARPDRSSQSGIPPLTRENSLPDGWNKLQQKREKVKRFLEKTLDQGEKIVKGQINLKKFAESQQAIITLFKDADASTLPHESAHWLKAAMESLVGAGFATDKMKEDLDTINAWLDKQDYTGAVTDQDKHRAREEYFARAFEQYLREGRFPEAATTSLKSALRRLARMLQSIYRNALALNAPIDDSIRGFFDDIFAVEEVVDGTSVLSGILREINTGALALSKEDLKKLETAVAGAREDAETEAWLAALQDYQKGLKEQRKLWRSEAKEAYEASKAEQAYTYVRNGHKLDENFLRNVLKLDEETISILKKKRLTYKAVPVEAPVEAPVVAETAAPAVEPSPTETPAPTASADAKAATPLDGTPEQFDALGEDTTISLPEGEEAAQNAVANLVYGPDGKGGAIWKRIKVNPTGAELGDVLYKLYTVALNRLSEPAPITKAGLIGYLSRTAFNAEKQAFRDRQRAPGSMDDTVFEGKDGDGASHYDVTPDERSMRAAYDTSSEAYLTALSDFTDTLKDGSLKREIADIIYELADSGERATRDAIMAEYRSRGGKYEKTALYKAIADVRTELETYLTDNGFSQSVEASDVPASILDTMKELDYGDVNDLITDLKTAMGRSAFIKDYMNRKHAEYRNAFLDNPNWASEAGATRYLDAILRALKVTEGMKFSERARLAASEATRELMASANVRDVMNGERGVATSLRSNAAKVLRALKSGKEDKAAAITAALDMYRNDARLRAIRKLRADIQKTLNRAKRIGKSKPGSTLDGDTINAVKALLNRFGMSSAEPQWTTGPDDPQSVLAVMKEFTPDLEAELTHWSPWMNRVLTGEEAKTSWQNLTPEQFYELTDLIDYLRGEGRQSLMDQKGTFASNFKTAMEAILPSVEEHKTGDYTDPADKTMLQKLGSLARSGIHQMKTLVFMAHLLDGRTEFYGDHTVGPVRKFFQLPLSEGASRELFWYQKTSKEIMPHLQALMRSAKERFLLFAVNNPDNRSYTELRGETAAFVLLNAGAVENRQRLTESFGWSEDELNGLLAQFTKEDFEHAEAIWKSLNEMGRELAKVYYRERHYRMPWATPSPISLTLNDGTEILSEGGYYPIAYTYHDSTRGYDPDIMNPFTKPNKPSRPTATFGRTPVLSDLSLLMSPAVVDRSIRENAHYIGMWEPLRMANAIWTNKDFKQAVIRNFSKETYDALKQLMDNVNNPDKGDKGLWKQVANKLGACLATTALGFKITTMAKQYASVTIGAERLGDYFHDAVSFALRDLKGLRRFVNEESPFMRDRYNLMDRDLRVVNTEFKKPIARAADKYRYAAFWGLKQNDLNVAAVQWYAAFNWALDPKRGMTKDQARAYADDFVASTQGAARTIDTPVVQLETLGRLMTPFFGPACAAANTRLAGLSVFKQMDAGERIAFAVDNFLVPGLVMTLVAAVRGGLLNPDDDDDWDRIRKQSLIALLTEPVSGLPVVQDIADSVVRAAVTGRPVQSGVFEVSLFRPAEDVSREFVNMFRYWNELGYTTYAAASIAGMLFGMPVVQVYEDYEKMILWNFGDEDSEPIKKQLKENKQ